MYIQRFASGRYRIATLIAFALVCSLVRRHRATRRNVRRGRNATVDEACPRSWLHMVESHLARYRPFRRAMNHRRPCYAGESCTYYIQTYIVPSRRRVSGAVSKQKSRCTLHILFYYCNVILLIYIQSTF